MNSYICRQMIHFREITSTIAMQEFQSHSPKKSWILVLFHTINKNCGKWNLGLHINLASSSLVAFNSNYSSCWAYRSDLFHLHTPCTATYKINFYLTKWTNSMRPIRIAYNLGVIVQMPPACQHWSQAIRMLFNNEVLLIGWLIGIFHLKLLTDLALVSFPNTTPTILLCVKVVQWLNPLLEIKLKVFIKQMTHFHWLNECKWTSPFTESWCCYNTCFTSLHLPSVTAFNNGLRPLTSLKIDWDVEHLPGRLYLTWYEHLFATFNPGAMLERKSRSQLLSPLKSHLDFVNAPCLSHFLI